MFFVVVACAMFDGLWSVADLIIGPANELRGQGPGLVNVLLALPPTATRSRPPLLRARTPFARLAAKERPPVLAPGP